MADKETKAISFDQAELKASGDTWEFTGYASTFGGEPDSYGDVVLKGAFDGSLQRRPNPPLLWAHAQDKAIGKVLDLRSDSRGLLGTWKISRTALGQDAYTLLQDGVINGLCIGFFTREADYDDDGIRKLTEVDLVEVSLVAVPANDSARVAAVKTDLPFSVLFKQLTPFYDELAQQAEALASRRASEQRGLTDAHLDVLGTAIGQAEAYAERLRALQHTATQARAEAEASADRTARLRYARFLADERQQGMAARRQRLAELGVLETVE